MLDINTIAYKLPIEIDSTKLLNEIDNLVLPKTNYNPNTTSRCISITNLADTPIDTWFDTNPGTMVYQKDQNGNILKNGDWVHADYSHIRTVLTDKIVGYYINGASDRDLIHWHPDLKNSEIVALKDRIAKHLCVDNQLRCRFSTIPGPFTMGSHCDPHTPWRVHVSLKTDPTIVWKFKKPGDASKILTWHQPPDSVWLIRTGNIEHSVVVPEGKLRWQLFYHIFSTAIPEQYYHQIA